MFSSPDTIVIGVIKNKLQFLSKNNFDLNYILSQYICNPMIKDIVGEGYVKQAIKYIQNNAVHVIPYWNEDMEKDPCIAVAYRTSEETLYIGDNGESGGVTIANLQPLVFGEFIVSGFSEDRTTIIIPYDKKIDDVLWIGTYIACKDFSSECIGSTVVDGKIHIFLKDAVPANIRYDGWKVQTSCRTEKADIKGSTDSVDVQIVLKTNGDFALHRLMCTVVRYCLKSGRLLLESNGFQVPKVSQGFSSPTDSENNRYFVTTFSLSGKFTEKWIGDKYIAGGTLLDIEMNATNGEECVYLE